ncbi:MAG: phasin family protein [Chloroflexota bacterium]
MKDHDSNETVFGSSGAETGDTAAGREERTYGRPVRRFALAGIGALAAACDSAEQTFDRLVDRGEQAQSDLQDRGDVVRRRNARAGGKMREYVRDAVDSVFENLNLPNKTDVDTINVKLNVLTRKIEDLQMQSTMPNAPVDEPGLPPVPPDAGPAT